MYRKLLCYAVVLSTPTLIASAFTLEQGNIYFDNSKALFSNVTMLCQGSNNQTEVIPMVYDQETGLYKATLTPAFEQYSAIGFINQEVPDSIVDKGIKDYVAELKVLFTPEHEDPTVDEPSTADNPTTDDNENTTGSDESFSSGDNSYDNTSGDDNTDIDNSSDEDSAAEGENTGENDNPSEGEKPGENDNPSEGEKPGENDNPSEGEKPGENDNPSEGEKPGEEPVSDLVYIGEISIKLPFETDNVFVPYLSETADMCGNWTPLHPEQFTPSGQFPILYVNTKDGENLECKAKNLEATFYFDANGNEDCVSLGTAEEPLPTKIKGRGNSTWRNTAKKPYKLKLDKAASFYGLPANKQWALMAHSMGALDWMVNASAFNLANNLDFGWHPHLYPIELVLNGNYEGVYFICETIKISEGRLDIFEQKDLETDPEIIPGGWLVEIDNYSEEGQVKIKEGDMTLRVTPHTPEELSEPQFQWLKNEFISLTESIYSPTKDAAVWMENIDPYDMAKYFVIQEIFDNPDGFNGSFYLHKDQGSEQKWHAGPMWDISCYTRQKSDWTFLMDAGYNFNAHWIGEMLKYPDFLNIVKEVFTTVEEKMPQLYQYNIDYAANVSRGIASNYLRWPTYNTEEPAALAERLNRFLAMNVLHFETKLEEVLASTTIKPTHSSDNLKINVTGNHINVLSNEETLIEVFDLTGRKIGATQESAISIPFKGVVILKVSSPSETLIQKLIIK